MSLDSLTLEGARRAVVQSQDPSACALQGALRIGHTLARSLVAQLQAEGVILLPMQGRQQGLHPDYHRHVAQRIAGDERLCHVRQVVHAALLCFELDEEASNGDSGVLALHAPPGSDWRILRAFFLQQCYGRQRLTLTAAALAYHAYLREQGLAPAECDGLPEAIEAECLPYERARVAIAAPSEKLARATIRLARYYLRSLNEDGSRHTRIAQFYIRDAIAPQNVRLSADQYGEHAVPCAVLRESAAAAFVGGACVREVADWIRRRMVVVWIAKDDAWRLDYELGLKDRMPPQWDTESGCCYDRFHVGRITFTPAPTHRCTCGHESEPCDAAGAGEQPGT